MKRMLFNLTQARFQSIGLLKRATEINWYVCFILHIMLMVFFLQKHVVCATVNENKIKGKKYFKLALEGCFRMFYTRHRFAILVCCGINTASIQNDVIDQKIKNPMKENEWRHPFSNTNFLNGKWYKYLA